MKNLDDLSNAEGLDESVSENYSYAGGWNPFKDIQRGIDRAKDAAQKAADKIREEAERQRKQLQELKNKVDNKAKQIRDKAKDKAKQIRDKAKSDAQKFRDKVKEAEKRLGKDLQKVGKKLKDIGDKLKDKFRNALRKPIRNLILKSIRKNIHGLATRMFTAIATPEEIKVRKFKPVFVERAKKLYAKVLSDWKRLGGTEQEFIDAVRQGGSKKILKNPFKNIGGNNPDDFYSYIASEDFYHNAEGDDEDKELLEAQADKEKADEESAAVINEEAGTLDVPEEQEKQKGFKAFIAKILALFKKNKGDENPYEDGSAESTDFSNEEKEDLGNRPEESQSDNEFLKDLEGGEEGLKESEKTEKEIGSSKKEGSGDDKILGMPKGVAIGVGVAVLAIGGFFAYKYFKGKK